MENRFWISETVIQSREYKKFEADWKINERRLMWGYIEGEEQKLKERRFRRRNLKYAYVFIGKTRKMCMIDQDTLKAYKIDGYKVTWEYYRKYIIDRYCSSMDL